MNWDKVRNEDKYKRGNKALLKFNALSPQAKPPKGVRVLDKKSKCYECKKRMEMGEVSVTVKIGRYPQPHHPGCAGVDLGPSTTPIEQKKESLEKKRSPKNGMGSDGNLYKSGYQVPLHKRQV